MLNATQAELVQQLALAIYAIRKPDNSFDPNYALRCFGTAATAMGSTFLKSRYVRERTKADVGADHAQLIPMLVSDCPDNTRGAVLAYMVATRHFGAFTDILGLAADWLRARGVECGEHVAGEKSFCRSTEIAAQKLRAKVFTTDLTLVAAGSCVGSSALSLMAAVKQVYGYKRLAKCEFAIVNDDPLEMLLAIAQVSCWLFDHPHAVNDVMFVKRCADEVGSWDIVVRMGEGVKDCLVVKEAVNHAVAA